MAYVDQTIFDNHLMSVVYVGYTTALCGNCYSLRLYHYHWDDIRNALGWCSLFTEIAPM
jgi:hypothetical protein